MTMKCGPFRPRCPSCKLRNSFRLRRRRRRGKALSELPSRALGRRGDDKAFPSLRPAGLEHEATSGCLHACSEPMTPSAPHIARLVRSFHVSSSRSVISPGKDGGISLSDAALHNEAALVNFVLNFRALGAGAARAPG